MTMSPALRKVTLTVHITCSVGWLGAIAAYITLNIPALTSSNTQTVRAAYLMMLPVGWYAIVPLALASLLTGIVLSLGTHWGMFRHYWVLFSLIITIVAVAVLLGHMADQIQGITQLRDALTALAIAYGPKLALAVLVFIAGLAVARWTMRLTGRGLTRYGRRKQNLRSQPVEPAAGARG